MDGKHKWWVQLRSSSFRWDVAVGVHPGNGPTPRSPTDNAYHVSPQEKWDGMYHFVDANSSTIAIYVKPVRRDD